MRHLTRHLAALIAASFVVTACASNSTDIDLDVSSDAVVETLPAAQAFPERLWTAALDYDWGDEVSLRSNGRTYPSDTLVPASAEPDWNPENEVYLAEAITCTRSDYHRRIRYPLHNAVVQLYDRDTGPSPALVGQAERGVPEAMFNLAYMGSLVPHLMGEDEVLDWLTRAAEAGHSYAALDLGRAHRSGLWGAEQDADLASHWLNIAASAGEAEAHYELAIVEPGDGEDLQVYAQNRLSRELKAAADCHPMAAFMIADRLREGGRGLRQSPELAAQIGLTATTSF